MNEDKITTKDRIITIIIGMVAITLVIGLYSLLVFALDIRKIPESCFLKVKYNTGETFETYSLEEIDCKHIK